MYTGLKLNNEDLVFGYDTGYGLDQGSSTRHYKGEPATNLITAGLPGYFGSGGETLYKNNHYGLNSDSGVFQRNFVTNPATASNQPNNNAGLFKNFTSAALSSNTEYVLVSFDFYLITPYVRYDNSGTGLNGYMGISYTDGTGQGIGWNTSLNTPNAGDDWNNNSAYIGQWRKIALYVQVHSAKTPASISSMYIYNDKTVTGEGIFTNFVITEHATVPTGPVLYTSGTRSDTASLIDLKKTTDIDVSNISFDSTGQPEMDGSSDYVDLGADLEVSSINQGWTAEYVFNSDTADVLQHFNGCEEDVHNAGWLALYQGKLQVWDRTSNVWKMGDTVFASNTWYHIAFVQVNGTTMQFYVNGVAEGGNHVSFAWTAAKSAFFARYVGKYEYGGYSRYFNGHIPVAKLYSAPLTATEIQQNYNAYKNRFNI